jgi:Ras GTPase-activating-like protein IQGAP2/3
LEKRGRIVGPEIKANINIANYSTVISIPPAEQEFDINEFNDLSRRTKPTLYIKLADIFTVHQFIVQDIASICPSQDDVLREVIRELGSPKNNESDMLHVSPAEITLTLNPKFHDVEGKISACFISPRLPLKHL